MFFHMSSLVHHDKYTFNTLEIKTLDGVSLYVPRELLENLSPYFKGLLSNGCKESHNNSCYLDYQSHIISMIICAIYESYRGKEYIRDSYFSKLSTLEEIYDSVSALTEYQLDHTLRVFDKYLKGLELKQYMSSHFINMVCTFNLNKTRKRLSKYLCDKTFFLRFFDYKKLSFEFTEIFYNVGISKHLKIFTSWASVHNPTDTQLTKSRLLDRNFDNIDRTKLRRLILDLVPFLENAIIFKCKLYEKIFEDTFYNNNKKSKGKACPKKKTSDYKKFIQNEMITLKSANSEIDEFEQMIQIVEKWDQQQKEKKRPTKPNKSGRKTDDDEDEYESDIEERW